MAGEMGQNLKWNFPPSELGWEDAEPSWAGVVVLCQGRVAVPGLSCSSLAEPTHRSIIACAGRGFAASAGEPWCDQEGFQVKKKGLS